MRITSTRKLTLEDFPADSREVVRKLAQVLNPFLEQSSSALSNSLTLTENLKSKIYVQALAAGISTCRLPWDLNERPTEVRIAQLSRTDGSVPTAAYCVHWTYAAGVIYCTFLGLDAAKAHNLTIIGQV